MTDKTKTGNELIAEFMGLEVREETAVLYKRFKWTDDFFYNSETMKFAESWDWLMPVWYKFRSIQLGNDLAQGVFNNYLARIAHKIAYDEIKDVHYILVLGIKWYNSQTKGE